MENAEAEQQALIEQAIEDKIIPILRNLLNVTPPTRVYNKTFVEQH